MDLWSRVAIWLTALGAVSAFLMWAILKSYRTGFILSLSRNGNSRWRSLHFWRLFIGMCIAFAIAFGALLAILGAIAIRFMR